jgi:hypothetical protein
MGGNASNRSRLGRQSQRSCVDGLIDRGDCHIRSRATQRFHFKHPRWKWHAGIAPAGTWAGALSGAFPIVIY